MLLRVPATRAIDQWTTRLATYSGEQNGINDPLLSLSFVRSEFKKEFAYPGYISYRSVEKAKKFFIEMPTFSGVLDSEPGGYTGHIRIFRDDSIVFSSALMVCLSLVCMDAGKLLLHASGVYRAGKVWLFCGSSGSGKTTIALKLNGGREPFSVDRIIIVPGYDETLTAFSTPFGFDAENCLTSRSGRVIGFCFIEQADRHEIKRMSSEEVISEIVQQINCYTREPSIIEKVLKTMAIIAEKYPCYRLCFRKDEGFWTLLDRKGSWF